MTNLDRVPRWDGTNLIEGSLIDSGGNIGIGTLTPDALLDVEGTFQLKNGTEGKSKLLTSDELGNASWRDFSAENLFGQGNLSESNFSCVNISSNLDIGAFPVSIEVSANYAYVVDEGSDDLKVIDITNPATPIVSGSLALGSLPKSISLADNYAYVVDSGSADLKVIDISDPSSPSLAGSLGIGTSPISVTVLGNYAYVVDQGSDDLKVIDINNPASPSLSGSLGIGSIPQSISVEVNYAYAVDSGSNDLKVIDIRDKTAPTLSVSLLLANSPVSIEVVGSYVYVVDRSSNDLKIIDISNPAAPSLAGSLVFGDGPKDLKVVGNYAFIVDDFLSDLIVIEISDPALPSLVGSLDLGMGNQPNSITVSNGYAYIVDVISDDLKIINLFCQMSYNPFSNNVELMTAQPNIWTVNGNNITNSNNGNVGIGTENPSSKLDVVGDIKSNRLNTGFGDNELYAMNQNVRTTDAVRFDGGISWNGTNSINNVTGQYGSVQVNGSGNNAWEGFSIDGRVVMMHDGNTSFGLWDDVNDHWVLRSFLNTSTSLYYNGFEKTSTTSDGVSVSGRINTGPGLTDVYLMNQNIRINDNVTFNTVNTGQGANELYDMNQNVQTTDNVTFQRLKAGQGITGTEGTVQIKGESGVFPTLLLEGGSEDISFLDGEALQFGHWNAGSNTFTERLRINSSGNVGIGTTSINYKLEVNGSAGKPGGGSWSNSSDRRLKQNINSYEVGLDEILSIRPVTYQYNEISGYNTAVEYVGVIAQELKEIAPDMVSTYKLNGTEYYKVDNSAMTYMLINSIKELKAENDKLKAKLDKVDQLEAMLNELKAELHSSTLNNASDNVVNE